MKVATAVAIACLSVGGLAAAQDAQAVIRHYDLNIPKQSLDMALRDLAQQTGLQIALFSDTIDGNAVVGPIQGTQSAEEALKTLLTPSGLSYKVVSNGTIAVLNPKDAPLSAPAAPAKKKSFFERLKISQATSPSSQEDGARRGNEEQRTAGESVAREGSPFTVEEVVVTAQKRAERLQDVPISLSVVSGADLDQSSVQGVVEALSRVPGVAAQVNPQGGGTQLSVRGVTAAGALQGGASPIAYYLDMVPFGTVLNAVVPDANPYDLDRVEVLRGPQGTLYGASAQNGVVRVLTKDPVLDAFDLKARTSLSTTEDGGENYRGDMAINVPLGDKVAARAVVGYQDLGGWIDRLNERDANDAEIRNARVKFGAHPTDQLSIGLSSWISRADYGAPSQSADGKQNLRPGEEPMATDYDVHGLKIDYDLPWFSIASATGYLDYTNDGYIDLRPALFDVLRSIWDSRVFSQEVILTSTHDGAWRWTFGGMYRDAEERVRQAYGLPSRPPIQDRSNTSESIAVFGELTRSFLDGRLELTGGLRYFEDDVAQRERVRQMASPAGPVGFVPAQPIQTDSTFDKVSPRAVVTWLPSDQLTIYGSYSEGFRSGSDQAPSVLLVADFPPLKPDNLTNYEIGAKGNLLGGRLSFDTAVYFIDWEDVQQTLSVTVPNVSSFINARVNGVSASGLGVDFGITARPTDALELGVNVSWNDLTMDQQVISSGVALFDEGERLNGSPEYTIGGFADYVFPLGEAGLEGRFSASANYVSEQSIRTVSGGRRLVATGDSILIAQTSFAIITPSHWTATVFVDNLNNEDGIVQQNNATTTGPFVEWAQRTRPRTIGLQLDYRF